MILLTQLKRLLKNKINQNNLVKSEKFSFIPSKSTLKNGKNRPLEVRGLTYSFMTRSIISKERKQTWLYLGFGYIQF